MISFYSGLSGFPAVNVWLVPRLDSIGKASFKKLYEANVVTHLLVFFVDILIGCEIHEYRSRIVDAIVNSVLPREVAKAVMVPTKLVSRSLVRDVGKELPRDEHVVSVSFRGD